MVLKMIVSIKWFQHKNRFEKLTNLALDIFKNVFRLGEPNQAANQNQFLIDISKNIGPFYKQFKHLKQKIKTVVKATNFGHLPQK